MRGILREFQSYVRSSSAPFVCATIRAVGRVANALPDLAERCLRGLMALVTGSKTEAVVAEAVVVARTLLQQHPESASSSIRSIVRLLDRAEMGTSSSATSPSDSLSGAFDSTARAHS